MNLEQHIDSIMEREGGFVNDPADSGGATKYGITFDQYRKFRGQPITIDDIKAIDRPEAHRFYRWYLGEKGLDQYPPELIDHVADMMTLHGGYRIILKDVARCYAGDRGTEETLLRLVEMCGPELIHYALVGRRSQYVTELVQRSRKDRKFLRGWMNRIVKFCPRW